MGPKRSGQGSSQSATMNSSEPDTALTDQVAQKRPRGRPRKTQPAVAASIDKAQSVDPSLPTGVPKHQTWTRTGTAARSQSQTNRSNIPPADQWVNVQMQSGSADGLDVRPAPVPPAMDLELDPSDASVVITSYFGGQRRSVLPADDAEVGYGQHPPGALQSLGDVSASEDLEFQDDESEREKPFSLDFEVPVSKDALERVTLDSVISWSRFCQEIAAVMHVPVSRLDKTMSYKFSNAPKSAQSHVLRSANHLAQLFEDARKLIKEANVKAMQPKGKGKAATMAALPIRVFLVCAQSVYDQGKPSGKDKPSMSRKRGRRQADSDIVFGDTDDGNAESDSAEPRAKALRQSVDYVKKLQEIHVCAAHPGEYCLKRTQSYADKNLHLKLLGKTITCWADHLSDNKHDSLYEPPPSLQLTDAQPIPRGCSGPGINLQQSRVAPSQPQFIFLPPLPGYPQGLLAPAPHAMALHPFPPMIASGAPAGPAEQSSMSNINYEPAPNAFPHVSDFLKELQEDPERQLRLYQFVDCIEPLKKNSYLTIGQLRGKANSCDTIHMLSKLTDIRYGMMELVLKEVERKCGEVIQVKRERAGRV
ncbi:hypothetical protein BV20DRAFT_982675 [Pilatotrama ljubarskyi]|nr:hypothetical protein BV20DRAFT_982675 [Pilatotrama ljubarskyi]